MIVSPIVINADFWHETDLRHTQLLKRSDYWSINAFWLWKYRAGNVMGDWTSNIGIHRFTYDPKIWS